MLLLLSLKSFISPSLTLHCLKQKIQTLWLGPSSLQDLHPPWPDLPSHFFPDLPPSPPQALRTRTPLPAPTPHPDRLCLGPALALPTLQHSEDSPCLPARPAPHWHTLYPLGRHLLPTSAESPSGRPLLLSLCPFFFKLKYSWLTALC